MAQPRLNYTMAVDGILPAVFAEMDEKGNFVAGTKISGAIMIIIATIVPFSHLDDLISSGILVAFTMTDMSVILVRQTSPNGKPFMLEKLIAAFLFSSFLTGVLLRSYLSFGATGAALRFMTVMSSSCALFVGN